MEIKKVLPEDLRRKFHSKQELYNLLAIDRKLKSQNYLVQYWMPPFDKWPMHFLRKVLSGEKGVSYLLYNFKLNNDFFHKNEI